MNIFILKFSKMVATTTTSDYGKYKPTAETEVAERFPSSLLCPEK